MTPEDLERAVEFLLRQQAQFATDLSTLGEHVGALTGTVASLTTVVHGLAELQQRNEERFADIDRRFAETDRRFAETDRRFAETDQRLNILIDVVERYFSRRDGDGRE